jgi:exonuclease SbcD
LTGFLDDLIRNPDEGPSRMDYLSVRLLDTEAVYDPMGKLREVYPNVLEIRLPEATAGEDAASRIDHRKMTEIDLFTRFYHNVTGEALSAEQRKAFVRAVDLLAQEDREAGT